tara:strand:+ start:77 stop:661 length:585 start_codon:yes stop_codon:yes gene_type:complete
MKKFFFLLVLLPCLIIAQVPQGVGYQGVATDANGIELVNQSISIRASVISASPSGTIEWQEIHNTSTDTFGLFNLTIGQGTSTGNGVQTSFADITWGANTHFLKIEMDVNGGTNYSHMGTNQMMSVPYSLYAKNAKLLPVMSMANRDTISSPPEGMLIYQNDSTKGYYYFNGTQWSLIGQNTFDPTLIYTIYGF